MARELLGIRRIHAIAQVALIAVDRQPVLAELLVGAADVEPDLGVRHARGRLLELADRFAVAARAVVLHGGVEVGAGAPASARPRPRQAARAVPAGLGLGGAEPDRRRDRERTSANTCQIRPAAGAPPANSRMRPCRVQFRTGPVGDLASSAGLSVARSSMAVRIICESAELAVECLRAAQAIGLAIEPEVAADWVQAAIARARRRPVRAWSVATPRRSSGWSSSGTARAPSKRSAGLGQPRALRGCRAAAPGGARTWA